MKTPPRYGEDDDYDMDFSDVLESALARDVEIYIYDLSEFWPARAVISNRTQDTQLNALNRHFLLPVGTVKAGMYIKYDDRYWIVNTIVDNNGIYEKAVAKICNAKIEWIDDNNIPHVRYVNAMNATQYNNGETSARYYDFRTDQLVLTMPDDPDVLILKNGKRFILDKRTRIYEKQIPEDVKVNTSFHLTTYQITRMDNTLYDYTDSGVLQMMTTQDEQHDSDGYYVINGKGYWLCDVPKEKFENNSRDKIDILYDENIVYIGAGESVFVAQFDMPYVEHEWEIESDFNDDLEVEIKENSISISTYNEKLRNKEFTLLLSADGYDTQELKIQIKNYF